MVTKAESGKSVAKLELSNSHQTYKYIYRGVQHRQIAFAMDPLGATPHIVKLDTLTRWNNTNAPAYDIMVDDPSNMRQSPFKWNEEINSKIILW